MNMKVIKFLKEYIKSPRTIGAVAPSSKRLAMQMVSDIDFENAKCIIEYGTGTGVFTDEILERKKPDTVFMLIEHNRSFYQNLQEKYGKYNELIIINGSAENVDQYLKKYNVGRVDYIVSGLPFASLPKNTSRIILEKTKNILKKDGIFITFQYTLVKKKFIAEYFKKIDLKRVALNLPPAYVFKCHNF